MFQNSYKLKETKLHKSIYRIVFFFFKFIFKCTKLLYL
ncbi:unnamed protein product [Arabidopsis halleri]